MKRRDLLLLTPLLLFKFAKDATAATNREELKAKILAYVEDTADVNDEIFKKHNKYQKCSKCKYFYNANNLGSCKVLTGIVINPNGWCTSFEERRT